MNHTPTPWFLDYGGGYGKSHIYSDAFPVGVTKTKCSLGAVHFPPLYEKGSFSKKAFAISEANATFIITACNAHEALLEAAKLGRDYLKKFAADACKGRALFTAATVDVDVEKAEKAIALAEGEEGE